MASCDDNLDKDKLVRGDELRYSVPYVYWKIGDAEINLDGHFSVADLRWLADFMSGLRGDAVESTGD